MRFAVNAVLCGLLSLNAGAVPFLVGNGDPNWQVFNTNSSGTPGLGTGSGQVVTGPATPPAGTGSFNFRPGAGDESVQLRTSIFNGTLLSNITALSYNTYATSFNGGQLPYLSLYLDLDGLPGFDDRLVFEPFFSTLGSGFGTLPNVALNTWQSWDLMTGNWYSTLSGGSLFSLSLYVTAAQGLGFNPVIVDEGPGLGGLRFVSGFASNTDVFDTNIDLLTFNGDTYNFEVVPELDAGRSSLPVAIVSLALMMVGSRRRRMV